MLAVRHGATVTAMHVGGGPSPIANLCAWIPSEMRSRCEFREALRHGDPAGEIITMAEEGSYDLIVLGSPRKKFLGGMVIGTTALRVVRHASPPVLSVP
jgi:nucleotide-binding universal stress UspA family protein